jgi:SAM-dependent methyltransferase
VSKYQFTDTDLAAQRLKYLGEVYAESTRDFIRDVVNYRPRLVLDLGCGPGYTTHLLADLTQCSQIVGLDNSKRFISLAEQNKTDQVSFRLHDITSVPFPVGPCDLLYCRYLLTHLRNPLNIIEKWATQMRSKGLLLLEEVEWIHTRNGIFTTYLNIVEALLVSQSHQLYVGPVIHRMESPDLLKRRSSQIRRLSVLNHQAATMFHMNIQSWKHQPFIRANYQGEVIAGLENDLKNMTTEKNNSSEIVWGLRQIVFERR